MRIFLIVFVLVSGAVTAQSDNQYSLNLYAGKSITTFGFVNSNGIKTENTAFRSGDIYSFDFEIQINQKHLLLPGIMYHQAGATGEGSADNMSWKLSYLGIQYGYGYNVIKKERFAMAPLIVLGADYLLKGEQMIGTTRYDVKAIDAFKDWNFRVNAGLNNRLKIADQLALVLDYRFNLGLNQIEKKDAEVDQKTRNIGHLITLGLNINF